MKVIIFAVFFALQAELKGFLRKHDYGTKEKLMLKNCQLVTSQGDAPRTQSCASTMFPSSSQVREMLPELNHVPAQCFLAALQAG